MSPSASPTQGRPRRARRADARQRARTDARRTAAVRGARPRLARHAPTAVPTRLSKAIEALERAAQSAAASSELMATLRARAPAANQPERPSACSSRPRALPGRSRRRSSFYARVAERPEPSRRPPATPCSSSRRSCPTDPTAAGRAAQIGLLSLRLNEPATAVVWLERAAARSPDVRTARGARRRAASRRRPRCRARDDHPRPRKGPGQRRPAHAGYRIGN